jgi:hypothetical protein
MTHTTLSSQLAERAASSPLAAPLSALLGRVADAVPEQAAPYLRGEALGHAAHPVLTDLPLGCWMATSALDVLGGSRSERPADLLLLLGIASAAPTAITGLADWSSLRGDDVSVGTVHAAGNVVALSFFTASLLARVSRRRKAGRRLALAGNLAAAGSGILGGHLALSRGTADRTG